MLKWTASAQKLAQHTPSASKVRALCSSAKTAEHLRTTSRFCESQRRQRRATIANKENVPYTSTPMVPHTRNSPLVLLTPLTDIRNITPEVSPLVQTTPSALHSTTVATTITPRQRQRRHSTVGFSMPQTLVPQYASTLPRYEEEYSPSAALPTGQQLALRGLLPEPFLGNARYFNTPEVDKRRQHQRRSVMQQVLPQKRKLAEEFAQIAAQEEEGNVNDVTRNSKNQKTRPELCQQQQPNSTVLNSTKMGDQTLDKLIDAILDSARKEEKKKKSRKSFNLRRRTLLKNQSNCAGTQQQLVLSPSYAAGDDPASDLSFLLMEPITPIAMEKPQMLTHSKKVTTYEPVTPTPATPPPGTPIPPTVLKKMPTPAPLDATLRPSSLRAAGKNDSFTMDTPPSRRLTKKRKCQQQLLAAGAATETTLVATKKFKVDARNYFEVGLALPSIYV